MKEEKAVKAQMQQMHWIGESGAFRPLEGLPVVDERPSGGQEVGCPQAQALNGARAQS